MERDKEDYIMMLKAVASGCDTKEDLFERKSVYVVYLLDAMKKGYLKRVESIYTCKPKALELIKHYNRIGKRVR